MAGLCWMTVTLTVLLSAGNSLAVVDQNELARIVDQIYNRYRPSYMTRDGEKFPMFSLAVSIPFNIQTQTYDVNQVLDTGEQVRQEIQNCNVYTDTRVVAATVLRWPDVLDQCPNGQVPWPDVLRQCPRGVRTWADVRDRCPNAVRDGRADHAEYRTLQRFNTLVRNHNPDDLLLFYVYASPCAQRCTNANDTRNILELINPIRNWNNHAFVFSKVFKPRQGEPKTEKPIPEETLQQALTNLGTSVGLNNISRCDRERGRRQCINCSTGGQVTRRCYTDEERHGYINRKV